jgi:threonine/homoserine/homoserine lactone efflux protein
MIDINNLLMYILASALLGLSPGPDNIFVLTQSIANGRKTGIIITLGLCTGLLFHTSIVAMGIAVLFQTSVLAFNVLKYSGAAYLLFLSWKSFKASSGNINLAEKEKASFAQIYRKGIIMNVTNPKVSIFFLAFLPQFTDASRGPVTFQIILLGIIFIIITFIVFSGVSLFAGLIGEWISKSEKGQIYLNRTAGVIFAALAIKLIFTGQK